MIRSYAIAAMLWIMFSAAASFADPYTALKADIGYIRLKEFLADQLPSGSGIPVSQIEAASSGHWLPDPDNSEFSGKTIFNLSSDSGVSSHATTVGRLFYGNTNAMAPGVDAIAAYEANDWALYRVLKYVDGWQPAAGPSRVANHSWIGSSSSAVAGNILRRIDWLVDVDEFIQAAAVGGSSQLMGSAFNVIAVGRTDAYNAYGTAATDAVYVAGRTRPDVVSPNYWLSEATPVVASAATLLVDAGSDPILSTDPVATFKTNRSGVRIYNAQRAEVVKAALMAGADRYTRNTYTTANITDFRKDEVNRTANGLDRRFGAGQVNVENSYWIIATGEQNSIEDDPDGGGFIGFEGFDYDPAFGGLDGSNPGATYDFTSDGAHLLLTASLVWHLRIDGGTKYSFDGTATLYNLDLRLFDMTDGSEVAASLSTIDNTENLFFTLKPNRQYRLQVDTGDGQADFKWDYALAWQMAPDADADMVADRLDNCSKTANSAQVDTDGDGYGNICDCDLNNDGYVNMIDYSVFRSRYGTAGQDLDADFNADGYINMIDYSILRRRYGTAAPWY